MNTVTSTLETNLVALANSLYLMSAEVTDIYQYYFGTSASTLVDALATGATAATSSGNGGLTKDQFEGGITLCESLIDFFGNSAVSTAAYIQHADKLINGSANATPLSNDVEVIGARLRDLGENVIQLKKDTANIEKTYNSSGLSAIIGSIGTSVVIYGSSLTQAKFVSGIVLVQQYKKLLNNEAVTTGDYLSTVTNFVMGS